MDQSDRYLIGGMIVIVLLIASLFATCALAHEHGRTDRNWEAMSDEEKTWTMTLTQPDNPTVSCCGLADQYWADKCNVNGGGQVICQITDDRDDRDFCDHGTCRPHLPIGTQIQIPARAMKFGPNDPQQPASNPTGHNVVFLRAGDRYVYCFVMATGG